MNDEVIAVVTVAVWAVALAVAYHRSGEGRFARLLVTLLTAATATVTGVGVIEHSVLVTSVVSLGGLLLVLAIGRGTLDAVPIPGEGTSNDEDAGEGWTLGNTIFTAVFVLMVVVLAIYVYFFA